MNVLVISAHPDDLEMSCGGTVAKMVKDGHRVINLIMYPDVDHIEYLQASSKSLGFETILFASDHRPQINNEIVYQVEMLLSDFKPDRIITHWKEDWHQDHRACYELGNILARKQPVDIWYMSSYPYNLKYSSFSPNIYVKLTKSASDKKYEAIEGYLNISKDWIEGVACHDHWRGSFIHADAAEVFMLGNMVL